MRHALARALAAARDFTRGFLGLAAPPPRDAAGVRRHFEARARGRTPCC